MKLAATLLSIGLATSSLAAHAQTGDQKPDAPAQAPATVPAGTATAPVVAPAPVDTTTAGAAAASPTPAAPDTAAAGSAVTPVVAAAQEPKPAAAAPATPVVAAPAPASATVAPEVPVASADVDPNYILGTDDAIMVHVWKEPTISGSLVIRPDGRISLPLVGDLPASGMTPMALAAEIQDGLKKFINDPSVTVTVTAVNSRKIFFIGEVVRSGPVPLTRAMTMLQAISAAGGLTPYANKKKMYILREEKGKQEKIPFDYAKALKEGNQQGVELKPGDTIVVP